MSDHYTEITHTSFLGNFGQAILAVVVGVIFFFAAFGVLWTNEGRVNLATIAKQSTPILAGSIQPEINNQLVAATGMLASTEQLGDDSYLKPGAYIQLQRTVEMYAWVETKESTTTKTTGGGSTTKTTYTYNKEWTSDPENSDGFKEAGHANPKLPLQSDTWTVDNAKVGAYDVDLRTLTLPEPEPLALDETNVTAGGDWQRVDDYIVNRPAALDQPQVGDVRISYGVVPNEVAVTLFGRADGKAIRPYETENARLYRAFVENREDAIATLNTEYTVMLWVLRLGGFLLMWFGLIMVFAPLRAILDVVPFIGSAGALVIGTIMFAVALVLSLLTILIAIVAHNLLLLVALLLLVGGVAVAWQRLRRPKALPLTA